MIHWQVVTVRLLRHHICRNRLGHRVGQNRLSFAGRLQVWNKIIEYKEIPGKIPEFPEIWQKSPEIPELSKWLGIAITTTTASDCQISNGHNSRRSVQERDIGLWLWRERLWEKESFKTRNDNFTMPSNDSGVAREYVQGSRRLRRVGWSLGSGDGVPSLAD